MRRLVATVATSAVVILGLAIPGAVSPAAAAVGSESNSAAQFLDLSALGIDTSGIAGIDGATAQYVDGTTAGSSVTDDQPLDVSALSALTLPLPNNVGLTDLLDLGLITQQAEADPNGVSNANTDTASLGLDLDSLLGSVPGLSGVIDTAGLDLGAVGSTASIDASDPSSLTRTTEIANANLDLHSPTVATLDNTINTAVSTLNTALNAMTSTLNTGLSTLLAPVPGATVAINVDLASALDPILNQPISANGVSIDLSTGTISVNLAQLQDANGNPLLDLNNLPPNSSLLSPAVLQNISAQVSSLLTSLQQRIDNVVDNALNYVNVNISGSGAGVTLDYNGSLGNLINNQPDIATGTNILGQATAATINAGLGAVLNTASGAANTAISAAGTTIDGAVTTATNALAPALQLLGNVAAVNLNVQNDGDGITSAADVTAVQVTLLPNGSAVTLNLATSQVGPNTYQAAAPTLAATGPVEAGDTTTVTGDTWPPNTDVSLQLTDPDGNPIGAPVVVTTDADGAIPANTTITVPNGSPVGDYSVVGTTAGGQTATAPFQVVDTTAPDAPVITGPTDGSTIADNTPTITGTGEPGDTVTVTDEAGNTVGTATVGDDGTWTLTPTTPFDDGQHTITATQTDPAGNASPASDPVTFTVDTTETAPVIQTPTNGTVTNDNTPTVSGTGDPGATLTVTATDGTVLGTTTVGTDGTWSFDSTQLADGTYTITADQTDGAGNAGPSSNSVIFTVDTAAPDAPVITGPADGSSTNDTTPAISGTGEPGDTVTVTDQDGNTLGTATVGTDGTWSFDSTQLADGDYTITATQTDPAGNTSPASAPSSFTVDTQAPPAPVITGPADGSTTNDNTPTISGSGEAGDTVTVTDQDGDVLGTAVVGDDGTWSFDSTQLDDGTYTITATQTDPAGNTSPASAPSTFTVDTTAPQAPVITSPADGSSTNDTTPTITGTGEPGDTVVVVDENGQTVGTATVGDDGTWTITPTTPFDDGSHSIAATQTDPAGNVSPASDPVTFTVDTAAPDAPVITGPTDGTVSTDTTPTISGTGEPGATVTVTDQDGDVLGTAVVGNGGNWSFDSTALTDGDYTITATQTDAAGNTSPASAPDSFTVDTTAPAAPVITGPANGSTTSDTTPTITGTGEPGDTVTVTDQDGDVLGTATVGTDGTWTFDSTQLADGDYTVTATQTDPAGNTSLASAPSTFTVDTTAPDAPVITGPTDGSTTSDSTPTITGTGEPGDTVTVTDENGDTIGTATVDGNGDWSVTPTTPLADGDHTITATQTDPAGNTSPASDPVTFTVDTTAPDAPVITGPTDDTVTSDNTPTISGTGEPGATVTVTDQDGDVLGTAVVGNGGNWSFDSSQLADGPYTITATQTDPAGNTSPASAPDSFTVDTTAPTAPVITGPADGSTVGDSTPTITGTGEPGATVTVTDENGDTIGTATVGNDGTWSLTPTTPLGDGQHTITATQTDPAGNTSPASTPDTFTVDTTETAPVIQTPTNGTVTSDNTPTVTGTGDPGAQVTVTADDGTVLGTATVGTDGTWSFDSTQLADGTYTITATQTDEAGNTGPSSNSVIFTVDTTADAPVITSPADGSTTANSTPPITGTGEPGATVTVTDENGDTIGTATVGTDGTWTVTPTTPFDDGDHTITATQTDEAGNTSPASDPVTFTVDTTAPDAPVITTPADGSSTNDTTPAITGTGEPGATVTVTDENGDTVGTTTVGDDGSWTITPTTPLDEGQHTITATQTDPAGNISGPATSTFTVDTTAPDAPVVTGPADGTTTADNTPTITGTGEPGDTVTVKDQDGNTVGTGTVGGDGTWTVTPTSPLPDGTTTLTATQTDPAGNTSPASDPVKVTVDTTAKAPVITSPVDGSSTTDHNPTVTGTGEPGATVTVMIDGNLVGTAKVGPGGHWSVPVTTALADGSHTVVAAQTDKAGNTSPAATSNFTVVPATPSITSPSNGDTVSSTPTVKGNAPSGTTVDVLVDGKTAGSTHADTSGSWSVKLPQLTCGKHTLTATASTPGRLFDAFAHPAARSTSAASDPVHVKIRCTGNSSADTGSNGSQSSGTGPAADTSGSGTTLPNTGAPANTLPIAALAGLLLLGGFALIGIALGRRHEHE